MRTTDYAARAAVDWGDKSARLYLPGPYTIKHAGSSEVRYEQLAATAIIIAKVRGFRSAWIAVWIAIGRMTIPEQLTGSRGGNWTPVWGFDRRIAKSGKIR
jgi:hypothetical protein